jgi:type IV secretory pathway VirB3-like protein
MDQEVNQIEVDHLALGLTKSPMFMGVNVRLFFANLVFCTLICINAHTILGVPLFVVLHIVLVRLSIKDPNYIFIFIKSLITTPPVLNRSYWGKTNSYEPW